MKALRGLVFGWVGLTSWAIFLVVVAYGDAFAFPFLADDFFQFPFLDAHNLFEIWQTAEGLQYFRPLSFTVWKAVGFVVGFHNAAILHGLNLLLHLANGLMVAWLAGRIWPPRSKRPIASSWARRYLAASLFLLYPFSYQSVSWIAAVMHPLATLLILSSIIGYLKLVETGKAAWGALSLILAFLAPFAHEIGILVAPFLLAYELLRPGTRKPLLRRIGRAAVWFLPALLWWLVWRSVPAVNAGNLLSSFGLSDLWPNSIYAAQATAYPLTWLGARISQALAANEFVVVAALSIVALAGAALAQSRDERRLALLPWLWTVLALAPAVLFIPFRWMSASPRVLMVASIGIALLWSDVLIRFAFPERRGKGRGWLRPALVALLVAALLAQSLAYIKNQTRLYEMAGAAIDGMVEATLSAQAGGETAAIVNFPSWLAPPQENYALGEDGVLILGAQKELEGMMQVYAGRPSKIEALSYHAIRREVPYHVGLTGPGPDWTKQAESAGDVYVTRYSANDISIEPAGSFSFTPLEAQPLADFAELVTLHQADLLPVPGGSLLELTWQVQGEVPEDATVLVHVLGAEGQLVDQYDGDPLAGTFPFWQWSQGLSVKDMRLLPPADAFAKVLVGLYRRSTGERLPALSPNGETWPDDAFPIQVSPK
jgi:hypothetical protein